MRHREYKVGNTEEGGRLACRMNSVKSFLVDMKEPSFAQCFLMNGLKRELES